MDGLPTDVLRLIFRWLPERTLIDLIPKVCLRWEALIRSAWRWRCVAWEGSHRGVVTEEKEEMVAYEERSCVAAVRFECDNVLEVVCIKGLREFCVVQNPWTPKLGKLRNSSQQTIVQALATKISPHMTAVALLTSEWRVELWRISRWSMGWVASWNVRPWKPSLVDMRRIIAVHVVVEKAHNLRVYLGYDNAEQGSHLLVLETSCSGDHRVSSLPSSKLQFRQKLRADKVRITDPFWETPSCMMNPLLCAGEEFGLIYNFGCSHVIAIGRAGGRRRAFSLKDAVSGVWASPHHGFAIKTLSSLVTLDPSNASMVNFDFHAGDCLEFVRCTQWGCLSVVTRRIGDGVLDSPYIMLSLNFARNVMLKDFGAGRCAIIYFDSQDLLLILGQNRCSYARNVAATLSIQQQDLDWTPLRDMLCLKGDSFHIFQRGNCAVLMGSWSNKPLVFLVDSVTRGLRYSHTFADTHGQRIFAPSWVESDLFFLSELPAATHVGCARYVFPHSVSASSSEDSPASLMMMPGSAESRLMRLSATATMLARSLQQLADTVEMDIHRMTPTPTLEYWGWPANCRVILTRNVFVGVAGDQLWLLARVAGETKARPIPSFKVPRGAPVRAHLSAGHSIIFLFPSLILNVGDVDEAFFFSKELPLRIFRLEGNTQQVCWFNQGVVALGTNRATFVDPDTGQRTLIRLYH